MPPSLPDMGRQGPRQMPHTHNKVSARLSHSLVQGPRKLSIRVTGPCSCNEQPARTPHLPDCCLAMHLDFKLCRPSGHGCSFPQADGGLGTARLTSLC